MVVKLRTQEGVPVHLEIPRSVVAAVTALLTALLGLLWTNQIMLSNHDSRLETIEATRFTAEDARQLDSSFVTLREYDLLLGRLERIEDKLDRALEERGQ